MTTFAAGTSVPVGRTKVEIEHLLEKWRAHRIGMATEERAACVAFSIGQWHVRFRMPLPHEQDYAKARGGRHNHLFVLTERQKMADQAARERWRALLLTIKAKLVSVENGVETFEEAFLAHLVVPGGATVGQLALPAVLEGLKTGTMPPLLLGGGA